MEKISVWSYRVHTEVVSFLILSKFRTSCGFVEGWEKTHVRQKKVKKASLYCHHFVLHFPISFLWFYLYWALEKRLVYPSNSDN